MTQARAAFFVDGSNFFKHCEKLQIYAYQLKWDELLQDLAMGRGIEYAYYYDAPKHQDQVPEQAARQQQFFSILRQIPWMEIRLGRLERRTDKRGFDRLIEKGVDVRIAVDMVIGAMRNRYDVAYLLSADGDFSYVVREVIGLGKEVFVATPGQSYHLGQAATNFIKLKAGRLQGFLRRHGGP